MKLGKLWLLICVWLNVAALILSLFRQMHLVGYLIAALAAIILLWIMGINFALMPKSWRKFTQRFSQPLPFLFLMTAAVSLGVGLAYPVTNIDTLSYRSARVFAWLEHGGWHWIKTIDLRENFGAVVHEFIWCPLLLINPEGRLLFLPNWITFLMLPGACFLLLRGCGLGGKNARLFSYILPMGWCFIHQAAGTTNDIIGAGFSAWSLGFLLRWNRTHSRADLFYSLLAISLCFGTKQSNWFLIFPFLFVASVTLFSKIARSSLSRDIRALAALSGVLVLCSPIPSLMMNLQQTGSMLGWSGRNPVAANSGVVLIGNVVNFWAQNLVPPIFPFASTWNSWVNNYLLPRLPSGFENIFVFAEVPASLSELAAGFGLFPLALLAVCMVVFLRSPRQKLLTANHRTMATGFALSTLIAILLLLALLDLGGMARYCTPYYLPLFCGIIAYWNVTSWKNHRAWLWLAVSNSLVGLLLASTLRQRPLWPFMPGIKLIQSYIPHSTIYARFVASYEFSNNYEKDMSQIVNSIPDDVSRLAVTQNMMKGLVAFIRPGLRQVSVVDRPSRKTVETASANYLVVNKSKEFASEEDYLSWLKNEHLVETAVFHPMMLPTGERQTYVLLHLTD